jgi:branched-chain amino acid transport system permease protein
MSSTELKDARGATVAPASTSMLSGRVAVGLSRKLVARGLIVAAVMLGLGLLVPQFLGTYNVSVANAGVLLGIVAAGIGFLAQSSGLISLGNTAFYGGAAYGVAIATSHWGWGPTESFLFAVVGGTLLSAAIGSLAIRTTGFGFLMLTLAFGQAVYAVSVLSGLTNLTGAFDGTAVTYGAGASFFGMSQSEVGTPSSFWPVAWITLVVVLFGLWLVKRSRFGIVLEAIRENEERARFSGYNTYVPRLLAFSIAGACASIAGALVALNTSFVSPEVLGFTTATNAVIATLVGGFAFLVGPVIGALLYEFAQGELSASGDLQLYMGLALVVVVVFLRGGVTGVAVRAARQLGTVLVRGRSRDD